MLHLQSIFSKVHMHVLKTILAYKRGTEAIIISMYKNPWIIKIYNITDNVGQAWLCKMPLVIQLLNLLKWIQNWKNDTRATEISTPWKFSEVVQ